MRNVFYILVALTFFAVATPAQQPNPNEILTKVAATYATCRSYYDEGSIKFGGAGPRNAIFRTTFVRPGHFAFEFWFSREDQERERGWVVWKDGESVKSWMPSTIQPGFAMRRQRPLDSALDGVAGASAGASLTVPPLLLPSHFRMSDLLASMSGVRVTGEEKIDGRETYRLEGTLWGAQQIKLWVDKTQ